MKVINDLFDYNNFKIVQDDELFKFSLDSILLAEFVEPLKPTEKVLDLCTGNGAIPLILSYYYQNQMVAFEIQKYVSKLAKESVSLNHKENQIQIVQADIHNLKKYFPGNIFDVCIANPPYFKYQKSSIINQNDLKAKARHEITLTLEEIFQISKSALKENGIFYFVHLPERLEEILFLCEKYQLIAKNIQFIYTKNDKNATIVLVKCIKGAKNGLKINPPLFINEYKSYQNIFRR